MEKIVLLAWLIALASALLLLHSFIPPLPRIFVQVRGGAGSVLSPIALTVNMNMPICKTCQGFGRCCTSLKFSCIYVTVWYFFQIREATKQIKFNTLELTLHGIKITLSSGEELLPLSTEISTANEMATLTFEETLPIGTAKLNVTFDGELNDKMKGMYRSKYIS